MPAKDERMRISISDRDIRNSDLVRFLRSYAEAGRNVSALASYLMNAGLKYLEMQKINPEELLAPQASAGEFPLLKVRMPAPGRGQKPRVAEQTRKLENPRAATLAPAPDPTPPPLSRPAGEVSLNTANNLENTNEPSLPRPNARRAITAILDD
jgi:hypothetical protein